MRKINAGKEWECFSVHLAALYCEGADVRPSPLLLVEGRKTDVGSKGTNWTSGVTKQVIYLENQSLVILLFQFNCIRVKKKKKKKSVMNHKFLNLCLTWMESSKRSISDYCLIWSIAIYLMRVAYHWHNVCWSALYRETYIPSTSDSDDWLLDYCAWSY